MKIVLIEPRSSEANVYARISMPLLGPIYLGTILRDRGHDVRIYNEDIEEPDYSNIKADIIGISILTSTARRGYEIAQKFPKEKVIMGGVHASLLPEEALQYARQVVTGEAEEIIADVVEGRITDRIVTGKPVQDLDSLPFPDFSLIKGFKALSMLMPISTSRGCPFDCSFCSVTKLFGRKYRFRSARNVLREMASRKTFSFFFCDDNFTAHPKRARLLMNLMRKVRVRNWSCQVRCDAAKDKNLLNLMARSGCKLVCVGFESINRKTLQAYDKKQTVEEIVSAIKAFHDKRIKIHGMFVIGSDDDNAKTVWDTLRFAVKQKLDTIQMSILTPFPGTRVYETLEKQKRIFTKDWSLYDGMHIVFDPKLLSARELQVNMLNAYMRFYNNFRSFRLIFLLKFRNAIFNMMGHSIIKDWKRVNHSMAWLAQTGKICP